MRSDSNDEYISNVKDASNKGKAHYSDKKTIRDKWIREYGRLSPDNTGAENRDCVSEIFKLVEIVAARKIDEFRSKAARLSDEQKDDKVFEVYGYHGRTVKFWPPNEFKTRMSALWRIGYNIPREINEEIRPERNAESHNPRTVVLDLVETDYEKSKENILILADCLIALGELDKEYREPTFEQMRIREGSFLRDEEYEVGKLLGEGGMSRVYLSAHKRLGKKLAIKELKPEDCPDEVGNECRILCDLKHPNIPQVYDTFAQNGTYYIVMEYIDGVTLNRYLEGDVTFEDKKNICLKLCDIMDYIHSDEANVVFADLKPQNIMIDKSGTPFLIDFGIAKVEDETVVKNGKIALTVKYTAPEVYDGKRDKRSDIYSFGMVLGDVFSDSRGGIMDSIIDRCTMRNPASRYGSFKEIKAALISLKEDTAPEENRTGSGNKHAEDYGGDQETFVKKKKKVVPVVVALSAAGAGIAIAVGLIAGGSGKEANVAVVPETVTSEITTTALETHPLDDPKKKTTTATTTATTSAATTVVSETAAQTEGRGEGYFNSVPVTTMDGNAVVEVVGVSREESTVDVKYTNNYSSNISTFGLPSTVINGNSVELDPYSNMSNSNVNISPNSSKVITYYVDGSFFESGGRIVGQMWAMDPTIVNKDFDLSVEI